MDASQETKSLQSIDSWPDKKKPESRTTKTQVHRCNLVLHDPLWEELQSLADTTNTTINDLIIRFAELGLITVYAENSGGFIFIHRPGLSDERLNLGSLL